MTRGQRIVAMPLIRANYRRGAESHADLGYSVYGRATWQWWCATHSIEFKVLDQTAPAYADDPPTVQRWAHAEMLLREGGPGTEVAVVDADTMIRWDTPNIFEICDTAAGLGVVKDNGLTRWIHRSIVAHRFLFPDVELHWWQYFNAGLVVLGTRHVEFLRTFLAFYAENRAELKRLHARGNFGTDQTLLNYLVRMLGVQLALLPAPFNLVQCVEVPHPLVVPSLISDVTTPQELAIKLNRIAPHAFAFMQYSYVWHFAQMPLVGWGVPLRAFVMYEALRRSISEYRGLEMPCAPSRPPPSRPPPVARL
jgi:hypothetical protein